MGKLLYLLSIRSYELIIRVAAQFNTKANAFIQGRTTVWSDLEEQLGKNTEPVVWIHCSSVGEYEQGRPVIEAIKLHKPLYKILLSFYSPSGYQAVSVDEMIDYKVYLPFDSSKNAQRFIGRVKPTIAIFIKYEFWYYYLSLLHKRNIPVFSVSSIFRRNQLFFKNYGGFYRNILNFFNYFFVQDQHSKTLLDQLNLPNLVTGDTRLDRVLKIKTEKRPLPKIDLFVKNMALMVIGSLRDEDVDVVIPFINNHKDLKFIIAPHEINEKFLRIIENNLTRSSVRYSVFDHSSTNTDVLIIDNIGILSSVYRFANYAYVGGGFSDGLHNILEPAVYEIPIFFGNRDYQRFKEAIDLIDLGAAFPVGNNNEFDQVFDDISTGEEMKRTIQRQLNKYLTENSGAADKIVKHLVNYLP